MILMKICFCLFENQKELAQALGWAPAPRYHTNERKPQVLCGLLFPPHARKFLVGQGQGLVCGGGSHPRDFPYKPLDM